MADLTAEMIDAMEAGPEMDALVAERVMGWQLSEYRIVRPDGSSFDAPIREMWDDPLYSRYSLPPYSTDIAAAWQVVEHMRTIEFDIDLLLMPDSQDRCCLEHSARIESKVCAYAPDMPLAICRAALKTTLAS